MESGVPGRFVGANVYDAPTALGERFDVVYTGIGALVVRESYFERPEPIVTASDSTYVEGPKFEKRHNCEWNHGVGEIATALLDAGFALDFVHEHREVPWQALPSFEPVGPDMADADGRSQANRMGRLPGAQRDLVPLMLSIRARSPA